MPTVDERVAALEAKVEAMSDLRGLIGEVREEMNGRFTNVDRQFSEMRGEMNARFTQVDERFTQIDGRFTQMDQRFPPIDQRFTELRSEMNTRFAEFRADMNSRFEDVNRRLAALDEKGDRHFTLMISTQVAVLLAVVGALLTAYNR